MKRTKIIVVLIIVLLFVITLIQNTHDITFNLLFWEVNTSMFYIPLIIIISLSVGYLFARITSKRRNKKKGTGD